MCIICASPSGVSQPDDFTLYAMFLRNPDGAGYMYARDGQVHIRKGFMDFESFLEAVNDEQFTREDSVVYHFRISTQAGVNPEMTHPFPLSNRRRPMRALEADCDFGVAHNGVILLTTDPNNRRYSDTALFINHYLARLIRKPEDLRNREVLKRVYQLAKSKFAIMDSTGYIATVGVFVNEGGILYSNYSYSFRYPRQFA